MTGETVRVLEEHSQMGSLSAFTFTVSGTAAASPGSSASNLCNLTVEFFMFLEVSCHVLDTLNLHKRRSISTHKKDNA